MLLTGSLHSHPNNTNQKIYPEHTTRQANILQQNHNFHPKGEISSNSKNGFGEKSDKRNEIRETFIGNKRVTSSSSPSSSAAEETATNIPTQRNAKEQPVARSRTSSSAFPSSFNQQTNTTQAKKSSTSTTLATPSAPAVETSASETGNGGISFLRNNFPFFRNSTSRSRSQSVISDVSRSSETGVLRSFFTNKKICFVRRFVVSRAYNFY